jgi:hypothetical protein
LRPERLFEDLSGDGHAKLALHLSAGLHGGQNSRQ